MVFALHDCLSQIISAPPHGRVLLSTQYMSCSIIVFTLKMESVFKNATFGLKMTVKSGLEKFILKSLHPGNYEALIKVHQNHKFSNKNNHLPAWRDFKINVFRPLFTNMIFRPKRVFSILGCRFHFEGKNAV